MSTHVCTSGRYENVCPSLPVQAPISVLVIDFLYPYIIDDANQILRHVQQRDMCRDMNSIIDRA